MRLDSLITHLQNEHPTLALRHAKTFYWSPADKTVYFDSKNTSQEGIWALLHETGHAILGHTQYFSDIELVHKEMEAWESAKILGAKWNISIDEDHVQDCIDSYRNWLHRRSLCPDCNLSGIQISGQLYTCVFCHNRWQVSSERFCRPYRKKLSSNLPPIS